MVVVLAKLMKVDIGKRLVGDQKWCQNGRLTTNFYDFGKGKAIMICTCYNCSNSKDMYILQIFVLRTPGSSIKGGYHNKIYIFYLQTLSICIIFKGEMSCLYKVEFKHL